MQPSQAGSAAPSVSADLRLDDPRVLAHLENILSQKNGYIRVRDAVRFPPGKQYLPGTVLPKYCRLWRDDAGRWYIKFGKHWQKAAYLTSCHYSEWNDGSRGYDFALDRADRAMD